MNPLTPYPITPIGSFLGFVLALVPLASQFYAWNTAILMYSIWIASFNFQGFVNTIIWRDSDNIVASANVWCDIGESIGLISMKRLYLQCTNSHEVTDGRWHWSSGLYRRDMHSSL